MSACDALDRTVPECLIPTDYEEIVGGEKTVPDIQMPGIMMAVLRTPSRVESYPTVMQAFNAAMALTGHEAANWKIDTLRA